MRFRLIEDHRLIWPVRVMCDALSASPSGYYLWRSRPESPRKIANRELLGDIQRIHAHHRGRYGAPRIHAELRAGASREPQADRARDASPWHPGSSPAPLPRVHDRQQAFPAGGAKPAGPEFYRRPAQSGLVGRRSSEGERLVLEGNMFIEEMLPSVTQRKLSDEEMAEYRRPFMERGEDRAATLQWPREVPLSGDPADVAERMTAYSAWLKKT